MMMVAEYKLVKTLLGTTSTEFLFNRRSTKTLEPSSNQNQCQQGLFPDIKKL